MKPFSDSVIIFLEVSLFPSDDRERFTKCFKPNLIIFLNFFFFHIRETYCNE